MKYTILLCFASITLSAHSQIEHFKATQFICTRYQGQPMEPPEFKDLNGVAVEFDMDSSILYIHSPAVQIFRLDPKPTDAYEKDSIVTYKFNGVDQKGVKCTVTHRIYESERADYFAAFILEYPDKTYMYYVNR
jgi:hypothetical protein